MNVKNIAFVLLVGLVGCKKDADVDLRDQYLGVYDVTIKEVSTTPQQSASTTIITKSGTENGLTLSFTGGSNTVSATLATNGTFKIDPATRNYTNHGYPINEDVEGEGAITGKAILMNVRLTTREVGKTSLAILTINGTKR